MIIKARDAMITIARFFPRFWALFVLIAAGFFAPMAAQAQAYWVFPGTSVYGDIGVQGTALAWCIAALNLENKVLNDNLTLISASIANGPPGSGAPDGPNEYASCPFSQGGQGSDYSFGGTWWATATTPPQCETCTNDGVVDPINPATGNVYATETDVQFANGWGAIAFQRFYNSADASGVDGVPGWRRSYDRSIKTVYQTPNATYPGQSTVVSAQYTTPAAACTSGFASIQGAVSAWAGATASYNNGVCVLSSSTGTVGTLSIQSYPIGAPPATPVEYDLIRDDGQILRYTLQNSVINNQPGISVRLAITGSGFTVTDDDDNVEVYNSAGVLQSITSRAGVVQTISYDSNGLFHAAIDSFGNTITVTRNSQNNIGSIAVSGGGTVQYTYTRSELTGVTNLDSTTKTYVYGNTSFPNALTSIIDESGTTFSSWGYDSQERATSTQEAGGAGATTLTYNPSGSVTITDALGAVRTFSYTRIGDINRVVSIGG
jgi:hypothetical protein